MGWYFTIFSEFLSFFSNLAENWGNSYFLNSCLEYNFKDYFMHFLRSNYVITFWCSHLYVYKSALILLETELFSAGSALNFSVLNSIDSENIRADQQLWNSVDQRWSAVVLLTFFESLLNNTKKLQVSQTALFRADFLRTFNPSHSLLSLFEHQSPWKFMIMENFAWSALSCQPGYTQLVSPAYNLTNCRHKFIIRHFQTPICNWLETLGVIVQQCKKLVARFGRCVADVFPQKWKVFYGEHFDFWNCLKH